MQQSINRFFNSRPLFFAIGVLIGAALLSVFLAFQIESPVKESAPIAADEGSDVPFFVERLSDAQFDALELTDVPVGSRVREEVVGPDGNFYTFGGGRVIVLDARGELLRFSNDDAWDCVRGYGAPRDISFSNNRAFVACQGLGIYEIDLASNRILHAYTHENGFGTHWEPGAFGAFGNPELLITDGEVWASFFRGWIARIDLDTRRFRFYTPQEIGFACSSDFGPSRNQLFHTGDSIWSVSTNSSCSTPAARFDMDRDTWSVVAMRDIVGNETAKRLRGFSVESNGIFALIRGAGVANALVYEFEGDSNWVFVEEGALADMRTAYTPTFQESLDARFSPEGMDAIRKARFSSREYIGLHRLNPDMYLLLSFAGLELFTRGDTRPRVLAPARFYSRPAQIAVSQNGRYAVGFTDDFSEFDGEHTGTRIVISDLWTERSFGKFFESSETTPLTADTPISILAEQNQQGADHVIILHDSARIYDIDMRSRDITRL